VGLEGEDEEWGKACIYMAFWDERCEV
jgi:hypothetical protein